MLSEKQLKFLVDSKAKINLAHGAVRSGKTYSSLLAWGAFCRKNPDSDLVMVGYSSQTIYYNAIKPFSEIFKGYCTVVGMGGNNIVLKFLDKEIRCIGANDERAVGKIQGPTLSGAYVDEMTLLPQNFIDMLLSRLSRPHSQLFATMNPDSPLHPIKTNLIDKADGKNIYELHFSLDDNPSLDETYKNEYIKKLYTGLWYRRFVEGEWCMAEGAIYDCFDKKYHVVEEAPHFANTYIVGIDYGTTNPFACVLVGYNDTPGYSPSVWVEKEFYWNPKETGRQKTDDEFADDIERFLRGHNVSLIYIDPSAQSLEIALKKRQLRVKQANNDVLNGIRVVGNLLGQGDLVICKEARNLIKEMEGYVWDLKKVKLGVDAPLKQNDHACDALRYALYSHFGNRTTLKKRSPFDPTNPHNIIDKQWKPGFEKGYGWQDFSSSSNRPW